MSIAAYVDALYDPDEFPTHTSLLSLDVGKGWASSWVDRDHIRDFFHAPGDKNSVIALSETGTLYRTTDGKKIGKVSKSKLAGIYGATNAEGTVIVCGFEAKIFTSKDGVDFAPSAYKFQRQIPNPATTPLEDLIKWARSTRFCYAAAGLSDRDFIVTGSKGSIVHYNGNYSDTSLADPVGVTAAFADKVAGDYVVAGHSPRGLVATGHPGRGFATLYRGHRDETFLAVVRFKDRVYVADASSDCGGIVTVDGQGKQPAAFSDFKNFGPGRDLRIAGSVLWALFEKAVVRFDGTDWEVFIHPEEL